MRLTFLFRCAAEQPRFYYLLPSSLAPHTIPVPFFMHTQIITLYSISATPLRSPLAPKASVWEWAVTLLFILDVILHFFHGYVERAIRYSGAQQHSLHRRCRRRRSITLTCAPFLSLCTQLAQSRPSLLHLVVCDRGGRVSPIHTTYDTQQPITTAQLIRVVRLRKLADMIASYSSQVSKDLTAMLRVVYILGAWMLIAHNLACMFFYLGWSLRCSGPGYMETWLDYLEHPPLDLPACPQNGGPGMGGISAVELFPLRQFATSPPSPPPPLLCRHHRRQLHPSPRTALLLLLRPKLVRNGSLNGSIYGSYPYIGPSRPCRP